jgi:hypothetical protein
MNEELLSESGFFNYVKEGFVGFDPNEFVNFDPSKYEHARIEKKDGSIDIKSGKNIPDLEHIKSQYKDLKSIVLVDYEDEVYNVNNSSDEKILLQKYEDSHRSILTADLSTCQMDSNNLTIIAQDLIDAQNRKIPPERKQYKKNFVDDFEQSWFKMLSSLNLEYRSIGRLLNTYSAENFKKIKEKVYDQVKDRIKSHFRQNEAFFDTTIKKHYENFHMYVLRNIEKYLNKDKREKNQVAISYTYDKVQNYDSGFIDLIIMTMFVMRLDSEGGTEEIDLTMNYIAEDRVLLLCNIIGNCKSVKRLILNSNKFQHVGCYGLGRLLRFNRNLQELDISTNILSDACLECLIEGLEGSKSVLRRINLSGNKFTSHVGPVFARFLELFPELRHFNISKNDIGKGWRNIFLKMRQLLTESSCKLSGLYAIQSNMEERGLTLLSEVLKHDRCKLKLLNLSDNELNNRGGVDVFTALRYNKSLKQLILYNCNINNNYVDILYKGIYCNTSLLINNFYSNKITNKEKLLYILGIMKGCPTDGKHTNKMQHLDLSKNLLNKDNCLFRDTDQDLINVIKHLDADYIDISQNIEKRTNEQGVPVIETEVSKEVAKTVLKNNTKILF